MTKDTVPNIITNGYIINNYVLKVFFSVYVLKIKNICKMTLYNLNSSIVIDTRILKLGLQKSEL